MSKSKEISHIVMGSRNDFLCTHCGTSESMNLPRKVTEIVAAEKVFRKAHKNCPKTWERPVRIPNAAESVDAFRENILWWLEFGEVGVSSNTILRITKHLQVGPYDFNKEWPNSTPSDPDDFRRCYLLLQAVPQLRTNMEYFFRKDFVWSGLIEHWKILETMLLDLMEKNNRGEKDDTMYKFMKFLGC